MTLRTDWYWIRHAPIAGPESRYHGRMDLPPDLADTVALSQTGRLLPEGALWLSSPLVRARATAHALSGAMPEDVPDFTEQAFGDWEGRSYADVYKAYPDIDWTEPGNLIPPNGESLADVVERVGGAIDRLTEHHSGTTIVAVAHASTIRAALCHALGLRATRANDFEIGSLSVTRLACLENGGQARWIVPFVNRLAVT